MAEEKPLGFWPLRDSGHSKDHRLQFPEGDKYKPAKSNEFRL
jgi:hypothetical protein